MAGLHHESLLRKEGRWVGEEGRVKKGGLKGFGFRVQLWVGRWFVVVFKGDWVRDLVQRVKFYEWLSIEVSYCTWQF